jgi:putative two-component system response regulator
MDIYDALTTERPYRRALPVTEALETMEDEVRKGWWDPLLFAEFKQMLAHTVGEI